jgi:hypothetical protein
VCVRVCACVLVCVGVLFVRGCVFVFLFGASVGECESSVQAKPTWGELSDGWRGNVGCDVDAINGLRARLLEDGSGRVSLCVCVYGVCLRVSV